MKNVFILGAGASVPYGMPLGRELVRMCYTDIENLITDVKTLDDRHESGFEYSGISGFINAYFD